MITQANFYEATSAVWRFKNPFDINLHTPDYTSESGSRYYYTNEGVYRWSDHWGGVASCQWDYSCNESKDQELFKFVLFAHKYCVVKEVKFTPRTVLINLIPQVNGRINTDGSDPIGIREAHTFKQIKAKVRKGYFVKFECDSEVIYFDGTNFTRNLGIGREGEILFCSWSDFKKI